MFLDAETAAPFLAQVRENPINAALLDRLPALGLADCWLVAGCLFQTMWNTQTGRPATEQIRDYDVFYCDPAEISYEAEDIQIRRLRAAFANLSASIELKNQARVHLWYQQRFGHAYPPLHASTDGIDRFLITCTCVGIQCSAARPQKVYASYGLDDLYAGILRPNPLNLHESLFAEKAASYKARWPWLCAGSAPAPRANRLQAP